MVCLLSLGPTAHAANTPSKFKAEHQAAAKLLAAGQWNEAADAYWNIVEKGPDDSLAPNAQLGLARAFFAAEKHEDALTAYQTLEQIVRQQKEKGTLSGQQPEAAWFYTAHRGLGKVYEAQKRFDDAAEAYRQAAAALDDKAMLADWRAWAYADAARCIELAGRSDEAVKLVGDHSVELDPPEFAGTRALQKATLAGLLKRRGETDRAEKLLAEIKSDPQLDDQQYAAAKALVEEHGSRTRESSGRQSRDSSKSGDFGYTMRTREGPDYLAIESVGRYELRIALQPVGGGVFGPNRYGWITGWYNLEADPLKTRNLSSLGYFPLIKPHHVHFIEDVDGQWKHIVWGRYKELREHLSLGMQKGPYQFQKGSVKFEVLEESPVRIRTRTAHDRWPLEVHEYTFYPTGQIFVAAKFDLQRDDPLVRISDISFYTVKNPQVNWVAAVEGVSPMSGEGGIQAKTRYVLAHSNPLPSFQFSMPDDILTCVSIPGKYSTYVNNEIPLTWRRAPLRFECDKKADMAHFALHMRVYPRDIDSFEAGLPYVEDYQFPDTLSVSVGSRVTDDSGDLNGDGYNESEGCYVLLADDGKVAFTIDATETVRYQPAFKITGWTGDVPTSVAIDGTTAEVGQDYNAAVVPETDIIMFQVLKALKGGKVAVRVK